jgi:hypothetical protein
VRRLVAASVAFAALVLGACEGSSDSGNAGYGTYFDECRQFTSCGTCTPVNGCGWCFDSDGTGMCAAGPDECVTPAFSWTWNPSGCRVPASVGTAAPDAGPAPAPQDDAALSSEDATSSETDGPSEAAVVIDSATAPGDAAPDGTPDQ